MSRCVFRTALVLAAALALPLRSAAGPITFSASGSSPADARSASVTFDVSGNNLIVTLTNTSSADPSTANQILTGVFFDIAGSPTLTPLDAVIANFSGGPGCEPNCSITNGGTDAGSSLPGEVSGEWAFRNKATGLAYGAAYGISSVNLGNLFSNPSFNFPGDNIVNTTAVGGIDYGITTSSDPCVDPNCSAGNDTGSIVWQPLISDSVVFSLSGLAALFDPSAAITNVTFNYGTGLVPLPEPATLFLLGFGVAAVTLASRSRKGFRLI